MRDQKSKNRHALVICGPTATGKTSLALSIASFFPKTTIISADSRQLYKFIPIISGQDFVNTDSSEKIRIIGYDIFAPDELANVSVYVSRLLPVIKQDSDPLIIVGGTGLYLSAITGNLPNIFIPQNKNLRLELETMSTPALKEKLEALDKQKAKQMNQSDINNPRRLIRAIEVASTPVRPQIAFPDIVYHWIGIKPDENLLEEKIENRVIERINMGAEEELMSLISKYPDMSLPIYSTLGVKQLLQYINQQIGFEQLVNLWSKSELSYAKRQMVWFKKQKDIIWYDQINVKEKAASFCKYCS